MIDMTKKVLSWPSTVSGITCIGAGVWLVKDNPVLGTSLITGGLALVGIVGKEA